MFCVHFIMLRNNLSMGSSILVDVPFCITSQISPHLVPFQSVERQFSFIYIDVIYYFLSLHFTDSSLLYIIYLYIFTWYF